MPASCSYSLNNQKLSSLVCLGLGAMPAFSGRPAYVNNPADTAIAGNGPIPAGRYYIVGRQSGGHMGWLRDWFMDQLSNSNRTTWFALYRNDGVIDDATFVNGVKRGNFRLHPNGRFGISDGCITLMLQSQFDRLRDFLVAQPAQTIPGTNIQYYGTVDVR
ncbi:MULTISPECIES: DUF2778 domain-containing protein [Paraburkholderia]|uniref:DUF2778 domain-containing protein n=1 Tax=Paraburkholderia TaxID=1822464 RepID=UPI00224F5560|nr:MULTISPECIES: DUF2778 domain-containing protein [Paraburkholderia]MCX4156161.1 DUF2778 domain-containing protein [Paraburkholderia aspalathi]MDN7165567.1 DUF2778 domain-containing protein [Paraburkholderia sp. SECH2]MDQ6394053.1 DUF2778 domain-containing protein [Paraburkholderia aspalathi]